MSPESGQPTVDPGILESIESHPSLQTTTGTDGQVVVDDAALAKQTIDFLQQNGGQPAEAPAATPPAEPPQPAPQRLLAGKYKSVEDLERAALEKDRTIRDREAELRAARAVNQHLEEVFAPLRNQRETPRERPIPVTFNEQNQPVVDQAAFLNVVEERAREIARQQVAETLQPLQSLSVANARLKTDYPESAQRESEFAAWLQANPATQEKLSRDPEFYLEGAYLKFERERGAVTNQHNIETNTAAQTQVSQARSNASPAGGTATQTRRPTEADSLRRQLNEAYKYYQETGDKKPYDRLRAAVALGEPFLNSLDTTWGR